MSEETRPAVNDPTAVLADLTVVDLSRLVSGNMLTHVLADMGATVIKVESPSKGDELRAWQRQGVSTYWLAYSRNKDSVELDLRTPRGMSELRKLLARADLLVENFRPGTLERMGLGPAVLQEINPRLVVVRISGWGQTGLFADKGGFGSLIEAMSGFGAMNGFPDRPPVLPPFAMADTVAGLYGASLALGALHRQRAAREPRLLEIDLSLFEPLFSVLGPHAAEYTLTGEVPPRSGSRSPTHAPRNGFLRMLDDAARCCHPCGACASGTVAGLPGTPDQDRRSLAAWREHRPARAGDRSAPAGVLGAADPRRSRRSYPMC